MDFTLILVAPLSPCHYKTPQNLDRAAPQKRKTDRMSDVSSLRSKPDNHDGTQQRHTPLAVLLWGRVVAAVLLFFVVVFVLGVEVPFAWGIGQAGAEAVQAWSRACTPCATVGTEK